MDKVNNFIHEVGWNKCIQKKCIPPKSPKAQKLHILWIMGPRYCGKTSIAEELKNQTNFILITLPYPPKSDKDVVDLIHNQFESNKNDAKGFIIDGFPLNLTQMKLFNQKIGQPTFIVYVTLSENDYKLRIKKLPVNETQKDLMQEFKTSTKIFNQIQRKYARKTLKLFFNAPTTELAARVVLSL